MKIKYKGRRRQLFRWPAVFAEGLALALFLVTPAVADEPQINWVARYHGVGNANDPTDFKVDSQGNVYVTGFSGGLEILAECATVKYSPAGQELWARRFSQGGWGGGDALAVDRFGNVYVAGWVAGHDHSCLTLKYDAAGVEQWAAVQADSGYASGGMAVAVDKNGNVFVVRESDVPGQAGYYYDTLKYNPTGQLQWIKLNLNFKTNSYWEGLAVDEGGNAIVTSWADFGGGNNDDFTTIKFNSKGSRKWQARYKGLKKASYDDPLALALAPQGKIIVTGWSGVLPNTVTDYATVKYGSGGGKSWVRRYHGPGPGRDTPYAVTADAKGNIYVTGGSQGVGTELDYCTIKYSPSGKLLWAARYNGPANLWDRATGVAVDANGNVFVTGISFNADLTGDYTTVKYSPSGEQLWAVRYPTGFEYATQSDHDPKIALDPNGQVVICTVGGPAPNPDYLVIKYLEVD